MRRVFYPVVALALTVACTSSPPQTEVSIEERIAAIETGLLPGLVIAGEPVEERSLADQMEQLQVPGVSIAVIRNGEIEWARGFGMADVESGRPVTPETGV